MAERERRVAALVVAAQSARRAVRRYMEDPDVLLFVGAGDTPAVLQRLAVERHGATLADEEAWERVRYDGIHAYYRLRREHDTDVPLTFLDGRVWGYELVQIRRNVEAYLALRQHQRGAKAGLARRARVSDSYIGRVLDPRTTWVGLDTGDRIRMALRDLGYGC